MCIHVLYSGCVLLGIIIFLFYYVILLSHVFLLKETLLLPEVCLYWYCLKRVHCTHSTWTQPMDPMGLCNRWDWVDPTHLSWLLWVGYTHGSPVCLGPSNLRDESAVPTPCLPYVPIDGLPLPRTAVLFRSTLPMSWAWCARHNGYSELEGCGYNEPTIVVPMPLYPRVTGRGRGQGMYPVPWVHCAY